MSLFTLKVRVARSSLVTIVALTVGLVASSLFPTAALALPVQTHYNHFLTTHFNADDQFDDNSPDNPSNGVQEMNANQAFPSTSVGYDQSIIAANAFQAASDHKEGENGTWQLVGPSQSNTVVSQVTYTGRQTSNSGRVTALAVGDDCTKAFCRVWLAASGGGIWTTTNGLATVPTWHSSSNGLASNAIGSITIDPTDRSGRTLYVGTGEANGSSDSEAGLGLYKSTDFGNSWHLLPGSLTAAKDRSIAAIAIDPKNEKHLYIGTAVARHGSTSSNGGRFTPPGAPVVGLYESLNGGATFKLVFSQASDIVNPASPNGSDFFRGGVSKIIFNSTAKHDEKLPSQVYFSVFDYGLYRSANGSFEQVFASAGGGTVANSSTSRTEFALAPNNGQLRIYLGDIGSTNADFYRVDNANVAAATLTNGTSNPGWTKLSNATPGTPGFSSFNFCETQCSYDMVVVSPPGHPDTVWLGGSMAYSEIFTATPPSNGRTVQRSSNAGVSFTDMTNDTESPPVGLHPDHHAIAFSDNNPDIAFMGSDGGVMRTSGSFANSSSNCDSRGLKDADITDCKLWLSAIPTQLTSLNAGLSTIQFQSVTFNPKDPNHDIIGGTQDNGTWSFKNTPNSWFESVGGDGGQSLIDAGNPNIRMHTYFGPNMDVNFNGTDPNGWNSIADPLAASNEAASFYVPMIGDPKTSQTMYVGLEHVWRTQDSGGNPAYLQQFCNQITGTFTQPCGDWVPLGGPTLSGSTFGLDKGGAVPPTNYVVAISRAASNTNTLWTGTRRGRLFISTNANADAASVAFTRIDTPAQPTRFISGIAVDPKNANHAFVSFSGYNAYTPTTPGHVFDVVYNPATGQATWKDISHNLGDQPITNVAYDSQTGRLYASTDFGILALRSNSSTWVSAASGLPHVTVYGLSLSVSGRVLYAATHGRGAWKLKLDE